MKKLPQYKCTRTVGALKIKEVRKSSPDGSGAIVPEGDYEAFKISADYVKRHRPSKGGYFLQYENGHISYAANFDGFEPIEAKAVPKPVVTPKQPAKPKTPAQPVKKKADPKKSTKKK